ncbi:MAG: tyrosine-type recombinase/integrase [Terriglobia bacterium]
MSTELVPYNFPRGLATFSARPPALFLPHAKAAERFFDFFTANIRNKNTRRAYYKAVCRFAEWCEAKRLRDLAGVKPFHVAAYTEGLGLAKPTVKQQLAALRMLFDWLVVGHIVEVNPAHSVRGPKYVVKKGKTPMLDRDDARKLIASIDTKSMVGLCDRALIAVMIYTFARVGAVLQMNVGDYFVQGRRGWVRLHEKNGKEHEAPCHHKLEEYLDEYIAAAGITGDKDAPLFRTTGRFTGISHRMTQPDAYRMIRRRTRRAGIKTQIGNHSLRATGITDYLKNQGTLENAQVMANHSSPRTTKLYDRRDDELTLGEYEKVGI